jgi:CubicO group peptidase (beta-lactamase class C family)
MTPRSAALAAVAFCVRSASRTHRPFPILPRHRSTPSAGWTSDKIWRRIGPEADAYFMVDRIGAESGDGGLNTTLRDLARFGEMMRNGGRANGQQAIPQSGVEDIRHGGDPAKFAKAGYTLLPGCRIATCGG